ncbi:MAG: poly-beta-1,6-N-acetyl-D-glucosamine N-deacetylase PgaB [Desulfatiglans sp.]|nr:poly-beta-1,6-N-acetyl-D-glucosamine N-deacetylase PgaB [Desulfatiglans sp.]
MIRLLLARVRLLILIACLLPAGLSIAAQTTKKPAWTGDFVALCYHDVADIPDDPDGMTISVNNLIHHFSWLREHGFSSISIDDLLAAQRNEHSLPEKAVMITFDDGYASFYHRVLPLLKAFEMRAVLALEGSWLDAPEGSMVKYGTEIMPRERFLSWEQLSEIVDSGLVEIASHGYGLHYGKIANPQGNTQPALVTRRYYSENGAYEPEEDYLNRIRIGLTANSDLIEKRLGIRPRVMVWPFGRYNIPALEIARDLGMPITITLEHDMNILSDLSRINRYIIDADQPLDDLVRDLRRDSFESVHRAVQVDLDYIYDPDPDQQEHNLGKLIERIYRLKISTVYLQAFADPDGDGVADALYFSNRHLPVRADLFNRVAWQLKTRAHVEVFAWLPVLSYRIGDKSWMVQSEGRPANSPEHGMYPRLSPFDIRARNAILDVYEDLARYADFEGLMFHDDGVFDDFEDAHPDALKYYIQELGLPDTISQIRENSSNNKLWTRAKTEYLIKFTDDIAARVSKWRPRLKTARNIFATPVLQPDSEAWFAQSLPLFLGHYDYVCLMAMPYMEKADNRVKWMDDLVQKVKGYDKGLKKTVFILQTRDWSDGNRQIPEKEIVATMNRLQRQGALHFGYYPEDFHIGHPRLEILKPAFSLQSFIYRP